MSLDPHSMMGRLLGLLITGLFIWGLYILLIAPGFEKAAANQASLNQMEKLIDRYRTLSAQQETIQANITKLQNNQDWQYDYLDGQNHALAGANLQRHLQEILENHEAELLKMNLTAQDIDQAERVSLNITARMTYDMLLNTMLALESDDKILIIDGLDIKSTVNQNPRPRPNAPPMLPLLVSMNIYGLLNPDVSPFQQDASYE